MAHEERRVFDLQERLVSFGVSVCRIVERLPSTRVGNHVAGQLIRCSTSPAPNYGEAQAAESRRDFIHKMRLCLKELRETLVWLEFLKRFGLTDSNRVDQAIQESDELIAIFAKSISTAQQHQPTRL